MLEFTSTLLDIVMRRNRELAEQLRDTERRLSDVEVNADAVVEELREELQSAELNYSGARIDTREYEAREQQAIYNFEDVLDTLRETVHELKAAEQARDEAIEGWQREASLVKDLLDG